MAAGTRKSSSSGSHLDPSEEESHTDDAKNLGPPSSSPQSRVSPPALLHRIKYAESILALAVAKQHVYAGTQSGEILKWFLENYTLAGQVAAHKGSLLCLCLSQDEKLLCSSASGGIVRISCTKTLEPLYSIYSTYDVGDVFCLVYSSKLNTVYLGAQNTSIQWYDLKEKDKRPKANPESHPDVRKRRFFNSKAAGEISSPKQAALGERSEGQLLEIHSQHIVQYAHYGYVHCMILAQGGIGGRFKEEEILLSGGGDGTIKLWTLDGDHSGAISELCVLDNGDFSVLSMVLDDTFLYAGLLEGSINVWDLDTQQLVRSVKAGSCDIWSVSVSSECILCATADGVVKKFNRRYQCTVEWQAHQGMILASTMYHFKGRQIYITGANDGYISIWDIDGIKNQAITGGSHPGEMLESLARFVSYRSISSERGDYTEGCRRGATFLRTLLQRSGAETKLLNTENNCNPIVLSRFSGRSRNSSSRKRILFYGHYDVVGATDGKDKWRTDPFRLEGINGFLYGRGVSDNKGPIIAAIYAAAELVAEQRLDADIIFLIEGEEECGSRGLEAAVRQHKRLIGDIDWILAANSYWIDDDVPCLTYGLRGVIHSTVSVESSFPDLHSGVDGSTLIDEPLQDLVAILSKLKGLHGRVQIPEFYKDVPGITKAERERYTAITDALILRNPSLKDADLLADSLIKRWQEPTLTVHRMKVSGPENAAIIPRLARAAVSIRLVPNQDVAKIRDQLVNFLQSEFRKLDTLNQITITINQQAEPWLGDPDNAIFQTLEEAIIDVWGLAKEQSVTLPRPQTSTASSLKNTKRKSLPPTSYTLTHGANHAVSVTESSAYENTNSTAPRTRTRRPLYIREGGSIGGIRFLEKEFNAPAAHLPCGQASDKAHLDNERLRLVNLYNSKEIFKRVFGNLP